MDETRVGQAAEAVRYVSQSCRYSTVWVEANYKDKGIANWNLAPPRDDRPTWILPL
jgi:hypothetical protein